LGIHSNPLENQGLLKLKFPLNYDCYYSSPHNKHQSCGKTEQ